jgi:hypothetical protein
VIDGQPGVSRQQTAEIVWLTNQRQQLSEKIDHWNSGMVLSLLLTFLAAAAVLVTTWMVVQKSKQLAGIQDRLQLANAEQANRDKLKLEHELSAQKERTASAEIALLELQTKVRGRDVTREQVAKLKIVAANRAKGVVTIQKLDQDPEATEYARQVFKALESAGWSPVFSPGTVIGGVPIGLSLNIYSKDSLQTETVLSSENISIPPSSTVFYGQALRESLDAVGIPVDHYRVQSGPPIPRDSVFITIGHKP